MAWPLAWAKGPREARPFGLAVALRAKAVLRKPSVAKRSVLCKAKPFGPWLGLAFWPMAKKHGLGLSWPWPFGPRPCFARPRPCFASYARVGRASCFASYARVGPKGHALRSTALGPKGHGQGLAKHAQAMGQKAVLRKPKARAVLRASCSARCARVGPKGHALRSTALGPKGRASQGQGLAKHGLLAHGQEARPTHGLLAYGLGQRPTRSMKHEARPWPYEARPWPCEARPFGPRAVLRKANPSQGPKGVALRANPSVASEARPWPCFASPLPVDCSKNLIQKFSISIFLKIKILIKNTKI